MTTFNKLPPTSATNSAIKILGIDPGYDRLGLAIIEKSLAGEKVLWSTCFTPPHRGNIEKRLEAIWIELKNTFATHTPDLVGIEAVFAEHNVSTVIGVAQVIGLVRAQAFDHHIEVHTFTPLQIKAAVTGNGRASKADMNKMTRLLVNIGDKKTLDDEMDAIAVALTTSAHLKNIKPV